MKQLFFLRSKHGGILHSVILFTVIVAFFIGIHSISVHAEDNYIYINDLCGVYTVVAYTTGDVDCGLDIRGGSVATQDENAPLLQVHGVGKPAQANQRFEFHLADIRDGRAIYYITSDLDNNGRIDVKGGVFAEGANIRYCEENGALTQRWYVRTNDGGKTYQIVPIGNTDYCLSYNADNECVLARADDSVGGWQLNPVAGDYGINTRTYLLSDNTGYAFSDSNEVWRYLSPDGAISNVIDVGVDGENITKTVYNGVQAFAVPYYSKFYINTSFVYSNASYPQWTTNRVMGTGNSDNGWATWYLSSDSATFSTDKDGTKQVANGMYVIEISDDNIHWSKYRIFSFGSVNKNADRWEIDEQILSRGSYIRVSYLFEIYTHWTTREWNSPFTKKTVDHYNYKNVREVSDSFYVCVSGFGAVDFGVVSVHNLSNDGETLVSIENGCSTEKNKFAETLRDGSFTTTGFSIECRYDAYEIQVKKNNGAYQTVFNGYSAEDDGKYDIHVTDKFGEEREITVYVCLSEHLTSNYFGMPFSFELSGDAFIQGKRVLTGNDTLDEMGITLEYSYAEVPVYEKGCSVNIKDTSYLIPLTGKVTGVGKGGTEEYSINTENGFSPITLNVPGYYTATLFTNSIAGDTVTFTFNWWVIESAPGPALNEVLITQKSQKTYDLVPVYYGVQVDGDRYTFEEDGKLVEKAQVIYYAFSDYKNALSFALRVEKEYAMKENGLYYYQHATNPLIGLTEYELFRQMYAKAKENVKKRYFSNTQSVSMRVFTPHDKNGNVRKYDDGVTETLAYCLEYNTNFCIVTTDKVELAALTSRQPYINDYQFISIPLDSSSVTLVDENDNKYAIKYDVNVEKQLSGRNAKSGRYTVIEKNVYGDTNSYDVYYLSPDSLCNCVVTAEIDNEELIITADDDGKVFDNVTYFSVKSVSNPYDSHSLMTVSYGREIDAYDAANIKANYQILYTDKNRYTVTAEDRIGNSFTFVINITNGEE